MTQAIQKAGSPAAPHGRRRTNRREPRPWWMVAPLGVLLLIVVIIPAAMAVWFSLIGLNQYTLRRWTQAKWVGLQNYVDAFADSGLLHSIGISVLIAVITTLFVIPIGVAAALATHTRFKGRGLVRSLFLVPYVLPLFVVGTIWRTMLQPDGVINQLLGSPGRLWLTGGLTVPALIFVMIWSSWPFVYLLALSGLQAIPTEVHEAAALDGAGYAEKMRRIVLPYLKGPVGLASVISILHYFNAYTLPALMFGVPAPEAIKVLPVLTFTTTFTTSQFGLGAAMSIVSLILVLIPLLVYLRLIKLDVGED